MIALLQKKLSSWQKGLVAFIKERRTIKMIHLVRNYAALAVVISSALLVSATNLASGSDSSGFLFGYWNGFDANHEPVRAKIGAQTRQKTGLALVPLALASTAVDPQSSSTEEVVTRNAESSGDFLATAMDHADIQRDPEDVGGVTIYTVQSGDTLSGIATRHSVTVNTILWANEIENSDEISPGDQIFILPVSGLKHIVKSGDSLDSIAKNYKADREKIIAFNTLPANGEITVGQEIIIPDGEKELPQEESSPTLLERRQYTPVGNGTIALGDVRKFDAKRRSGNYFPYGYCTYYVAQRRSVPWRGNAGAWLYNAKAVGYKTGKAPKVGSIVVTTDNAYYGHVAFVEKVSGDTITVSEMNYRGWGKVNTRVIHQKSRSIRGYIY